MASTAREGSLATNLELDDNLVQRAMTVTGIRTKKALVEEALRALIRQHEQREVRDLRGRLRWEEPGRPKRRRGA
jgi:Arc/MetJ family transcription regulator